MISKKSLFSNIFIAISIVLSISFSVNVFALKPEKPPLPLDQLKKFSEVYTRIKNDYVEHVDDKQLISNAIKGMLEGLDPHSTYLNETNFKELKEDTSGEFGGLGLEVDIENGFIKVIAPIDGTPAKEAGIKSGDLIIRIDNKPTRKMSLNDAIEIMRGKPGEPIDLVITRENVAQPIKVNIVRAIIKVKSVNHKLLEKDYGYIRITSFQSKTTENTRQAVKSLISDNKTNLKGLILDLRDNPGGLLTAAVGVSDTFLDNGNIVYTEGRVRDATSSYDASTKDMLNGAPLIIIVNQGSASASEIVAGALQDHKRALILGTRTFGKGSVQTILPLDNTTGLKLTTARYFTPLGHSIQAKGIEPDIEVETLEFKTPNAKHNQVTPLSEADLSGHLTNPNQNSSSKKNTHKEKLINSDFQLYEAMNILKGMSLARLMNQN